jgi:hypothetical protein
VEHPAVAKQVMEVLHHLLVPHNVLQCFRANDLIEFPSKLRQIVKIADFELQPLGVSFDEAKILTRLLHLADVHRNAENPVPALISGIRQRSVAAPRIQSVDWPLAEKSWKKAVPATCVEIKPWKQESFSAESHSIAYGQRIH